MIPHCHIVAGEYIIRNGNVLEKLVGVRSSF